MANENCLEGMKCPKCGNEDVFRISCEVVCKVTDEGAEGFGDTYWDDESWCYCSHCEKEGKVKDFYIPGFFTPAGANKSEINEDTKGQQ